MQKVLYNLCYSETSMIEKEKLSVLLKNSKEM